MEPKPGDRFYSDYFKSWGTVTKFLDDNNWWFELDDRRFFGELKARARPSELREWRRGGLEDER